MSVQEQNSGSPDAANAGAVRGSPGDAPGVVASQGGGAKQGAQKRGRKAKADAAQTVTTPEPGEPDSLPESVTLAAPHGFYDSAGDLQAWLTGEVVTDKDEIALLFKRGARLVGFGED